MTYTTVSPTPYLARRLHPLDETETNDDPGAQETEDQLPSQSAIVFPGGVLLQAQDHALVVVLTWTGPVIHLKRTWRISKLASTQSAIICYLFQRQNVSPVGALSEVVLVQLVDKVHLVFCANVRNLCALVVKVSDSAIVELVTVFSHFLVVAETHI